LHRGKSHWYEKFLFRPERGGYWNSAWKDFINKNPNATPKQILRHLKKMMDEEGIGDLF